MGVGPEGSDMGILRLAHVDVTVTDLDLAAAYYTEVMGMLEVERDENSVYLKCWDEVDHHSLRISYAPVKGYEENGVALPWATKLGGYFGLTSSIKNWCRVFLI